MTPRGQYVIRHRTSRRFLAAGAMPGLYSEAQDPAQALAFRTPDEATEVWRGLEDFAGAWMVLYWTEGGQDG